MSAADKLAQEHETWWDPTRGVSGCSCGHIYAGMAGAVAERRHLAAVVLAHLAAEGCHGRLERMA